MTASTIGRTQADPFSTGRMRSVGKRVSRPCPMSDATVSKIPRLCVCAMSEKADLPPANGSSSPPCVPFQSL